MVLPVAAHDIDNQSRHVTVPATRLAAALQFWKSVLWQHSIAQRQNDQPRHSVCISDEKTSSSILRDRSASKASVLAEQFIRVGEAHSLSCCTG